MAVTPDSDLRAPAPAPVPATARKRSVTARRGRDTVAVTTPPGLRLAGGLESSAPPSTPPIAPFRWAAVLIAAIVALPRLYEHDVSMLIGLGVATAYALFRTFVPIRNPTGRAGTVALMLDAAIHTELVLLTGAWASPFAFTLLPSVVQAGFARGSGFAIRVALGTVVLISVPYLAVTQELSEGLRDTAAWLGVLLLVAITSGIARKVSTDWQREKTIALDRLSSLAEANTLLHSLYEVAQALPASLDQAEVLDSAAAQVRQLMPVERMVLYVYEDTDRRWFPAREWGVSGSGVVANHELPAPLRRAVQSSVAIVEPDLLVTGGPGVTPAARSGVYAPLRARGEVVGLLAVESQQGGRFSAREVQLLNGLVAPVGVAIDNARWFTRLRTIGAAEERNRLARDLHDQIGQSLATLAFGLDRAMRSAERGDDVRKQLDELRNQLRGTIREVREALYDLRTDVSEEQDIVATLHLFLERVQDRTGLDVRLTTGGAGRLPLLQEREMWWVAREAIVNAERHARAKRLRVHWHCDDRHAVLRVTDDGIGFTPGSSGRPDSFGLLGIRERASGIGAAVTVHSAPGLGTAVRVELDLVKGVQRW